MRGSRSCPQKSSPRFAMVYRVQLFALLSAELRSSYGSGARCCGFHQARSRLTGASPKQLASRKPLAQSGAQSAPTRLRLSFRATASFAKRAHSAIIIGTRFANAPSSDGSSCHQTRSAGKKPIESGPPRLNNQPKIDTVAAPKYCKGSLLADGQEFSRFRRLLPRVQMRRVAAGRTPAITHRTHLLTGCP